ncbi:hypothetical protein, partial [Lysobacter capsici]|uniref:hypothetical protein n=1 Tax=Lysobacter capsici TaxID=435897 RepID=UPI00398CCAB5
ATRIHARRPSGVLLLTRVSGFAALDELRGFRLKPRPRSRSKPKPKQKQKTKTKNQGRERG